MNKFKSGDTVICKKEYKDKSWYFDTPKEIEGYSILGMALIGESGSFMSEDYFELAPTSKFKVGDYVGSELFEGIRQISTIATGANFCTIKVNGKWYNSKYLTLVCGFVKGQALYASNYSEKCSSKFKVTFDSYRQDATYPFLCKTEFYNESALESYKYTKAIQPKYKPYEKFNDKWIGEELLVSNPEFNCVATVIIVGKMNNGIEQLLCVRDELNDISWFKDYKNHLFKYATWSNGTLFGELECVN